MPLKNYGLLKGKAIDVRQGAGENPHYQVHIIDDNAHYRIAINIQSALYPSELEYLILENFTHPILPIIESCPLGFTKINSEPDSFALDFIRGNLFDRKLMKILAPNIPGPDNDLNDKIERTMQRALATENAIIYAFGERWGPEKNKKDRYFGFLPGNGIHDIHMNQSNVGKFVVDDGIWQDGGILVNFPSQNQWIAIFLKFQSQGWHTDDMTGHKIPETEVELKKNEIKFVPNAYINEFLPTFDDPQGMVKIMSALVNSKQSPELEIVTLINITSMDLSIDGWAILDTQKNKQHLKGIIKSGEAKAFPVSSPVKLSNKGGLITLVNEKGLKIDGVAYTKQQASNPGWTIIF